MSKNRRRVEVNPLLFSKEAAGTGIRKQFLL